MQNTQLEHPTNESLERFLLHQLGGMELETVETHILACAACITQLEGLEAFIAGFKIVAAGADVPTPRRSSQLRVPGTIWAWLTLPHMKWVAAAALLAAAVVVIPRGSAPGRRQPVAVTLSALRGSETPTLPDGRPLDMSLNCEGLAAGPVAVELVDSFGAPVWHGRSQIVADSASVRVSPLAPARVYFLRIFALDSGGHSRDLLREYAVQTR